MKALLSCVVVLLLAMTAGGVAQTPDAAVVRQTRWGDVATAIAGGTPITALKLTGDAVIGVNLGHLWDHIGMLRREMASLLGDFDAGRLKAVVGKTFPLVEAAKAHRFMQERQNVGKVVLTCAET